MSGWSWICSEADRVSSGARTTTANRAERTRAVCDGLRAALAAYGVPEQILTDNAKVFTGRFFHPSVEVLLDRICRENGIEHLLTAPRSPTTTGKIERSHRSLRAEFLSQQPSFTNLKTAQQALGEWVDYYNTVRPHQSLHMATPREKFTASPAVSPSPAPQPLGSDGDGDVMTGSAAVSPPTEWCVSWQQVSVGRHHAGVGSRSRGGDRAGSRE